MYAIITALRSLSGALTDNEDQVKAGKAKALLAMNYKTDMAVLTLTRKLRPLERLADRNPEVSLRCLRITLNFDPTECLDTQLCLRISSEYMHRIGLGAQPYLVYVSEEPPHPWLSIITAAVDPKGQRISITELLRVKSRLTTELLEKEYDLIKTPAIHQNGKAYEKEARAAILGLPPEEEPDVPYVSLKEVLDPAGQKALARVLADYRFTTIEEFNALLSPFRLKAIWGTMYSSDYGLIYQVLDKEGGALDRFIRAAALPGKPTLASMQNRFEEHRPGQGAHAARVRKALDKFGKSKDAHCLPCLHRDLEKAGIQAVWTRPGKTIVPTIVYIDHQTHWAFGEVALGEPYSAPALMKRCHWSLRDLEKFLTETTT